MLKNLFRRKSLSAPSYAQMGLSYLVLGIWAVVVLFPIYWLVVTSFKRPMLTSMGSLNEVTRSQ